VHCRDDPLERLILADASHRSGIEQRLDLSLAGGRRERDDRDLGPVLPHEPRDLDAVEARQPVVDEQDVRPQLGSALDDVFPGRVGAGDLDVTLQREEHLQRVSEDVVVLDEQNPEHLLGGQE
jgi:hypothetical protein